jgi:hypothetical protein
VKHSIPDLSFPVLFSKAISDWPKSIDIHGLLSNDSRPDLYVVAGLSEKCEKITEYYIGRVDEILMRNLHEAISSTIRLAAQFSTHISLDSLRCEAVQVNFEKRLKRAISDSDLGWNSDDVLLANEFFSANKK